MKKAKLQTLACTTVLGGFLILATALSASTMNTVKDAVLRDSPSFLGKVVETLDSGTAIVLVSEKDAWAKVKARGKQGWLPISALRVSAVSLGAGANIATVRAASSEVALAGKGFTQQTEAAHRESQSGLDYATVDMMAGFVVPPADSEKFLRTGREGAAQ
jgi:uncharacterized protein YgiM (DUF1202 family)